MKILLLYALLIVSLLIPTTVRADSIDVVPVPPKYNIVMDYFIFVDVNENDRYDYNEDYPAAYATAICLIGGNWYEYVANVAGRINDVIEVWHGDNYRCRFRYTDDDNREYQALHIMYNITSDLYFAQDIAMLNPVIFLPITAR